MFPLCRSHSQYACYLYGKNCDDNTYFQKYYVVQILNLYIRLGIPSKKLLFPFLKLSYLETDIISLKIPEIFEITVEHSLRKYLS